MRRPPLRSNLSAFLGRGEIDELSREADREWPIYDHHVICQRYNRIAAFIPFFEYAFFMPSGLRKRAVDQLKLRQGDRAPYAGPPGARREPGARGPAPGRPRPGARADRAVRGGRLRLDRGARRHGLAQRGELQRARPADGNGLTSC